MKLIPPFIQHYAKSKAECRLFNELKDIDLANAVCLHSVNLPEHIYKSNGEIDFLIVCPGGVFVLEVKGGGVTCEQGVWMYQDRWGEKHHSSEGPFKQASSAMYSLKKLIEEKLGKRFVTKIVFGYGVVFPDCKFYAEGIEWDERIVLDDHFWNTRGVKKYLQDLFIHWHQKSPDHNPLTLEEIQKLVQVIRPDFEMSISLRVQMEEIEGRLVKLTEEQYERLDIIEHCPRILVQGGAGTGKTMLAGYLAQRHANSNQKTLLICQSPLLAVFLKKNFSRNNLEVSSLPNLMLQTAKKYHMLPKGYFPGLPVNDYWFKNVLAPAFVNAAKKLPADSKFDVLIIDEAQDIIESVYFEGLDKVLKGGISEGIWRIFMDPLQQARISGEMDLELLDILKLTDPIPPKLTINCRNTDPIVLQTRMATGAFLSKKGAGPGPDVVIKIYRSLQDQARLIEEFLEKAREKDISPENITLLSSKGFQDSAASLLPQKWIQKIHLLNGSSEGLFPFRGITFATIMDFKGLENSYIALLDINQLEETQENVSNLYVGMTRARVQLWMFLHDSIQKDYQKICLKNLQLQTEEK